MNAVKNLMRMEWYKLTCMRKMLCLYFALLIFCSITLQSAIFLFFMVLYLLTYTPLAYDEQSKGDCLLGALPVERAQVVWAKYLVSALELAGIVLLLGTSGYLFHLLLEIPEAFRLTAESLALLFFAGTVFVGLVLPCMLCLGTIKARYFSLGLYVVIFGLIGASSALFDEGELAWLIDRVSGGWMIPLGLALLMVSCAVAASLYRRRQFTG